MTLRIEASPDGAAEYSFDLVPKGSGLTTTAEPAHVGRAVAALRRADSSCSPSGSPYAGTSKSVSMHLLAPLVMLATLLSASVSAQGQHNLDVFAVRSGYALSVDSHGFALPTSIAFVPAPGEAPDDPLYFVAELRGTIKVVTRDRQVREFAKVPSDRGQDPGLYGDAQGGLGGLCLDPQNGYVFATYTGLDEGGVLRNRIVRFTSEPVRFGLKPAGMRRLDGMLAPFQAAPAHQIGNCVVESGRLLVGVGDGGNPNNARNTSVLTGKVLCLTTDGDPCPDNPALRSGEVAASPRDGEASPPEAFIYAHGLRNPFGLALVRGELYSVDNGVAVDRFLRVLPGQDYLWSGTDQSLTTRADLVFTPAIGPVQLAHLPADSTIVDEVWRDGFVTAAFSSADTSAGLVAFGAASGRPPHLPQYLLEYTGKYGTQRFAAVAVGPDGIYTAPMVPGPDGSSPVLRIRYEPSQAHPVTVQPRAGLQSMAGFGALAEHGCISCHAVQGTGGGIGPTLDYFGLEWRLTKRLNSAEYVAQVARVDALEAEPFSRWREARRDVLAAEGAERTWRWLRYFLQEPRFDNPEAQMPNLGISAEQAARLRAELSAHTGFTAAGSSPWTRYFGAVRRNALPLLAGAVAGAGGVFAAGLALFFLWRWRSQRLRRASV